MNLRKLVILLLSLLCLPACAQIQTNVVTTVSDLTANFVGDWVGTDQYLKNGVSITHPVVLKVTKTKKKNSIRLDYVYGKKGEKSFDQASRSLTFGPKASEVTLQWKGSSKEIYQATGVDKFTETGYGDFTISNSDPIVGKDDKKWLYRAKFHLDPNKFSYEWQAASDGKNFQTTALFIFVRQRVNATDFDAKQAPSKLAEGNLQ